MKRLTVKEEEIMRMFWEHGPMFVRELLVFYEEPKPHYNTVSTLVRGLEEKGFVGYKAYGNTYQYYPLISAKDYKRSALNDVIAHYYDNSFANVVSSFVEEEGMPCSSPRSAWRCFICSFGCALGAIRCFAPIAFCCWAVRRAACCCL